MIDSLKSTVTEHAHARTADSKISPRTVSKERITTTFALDWTVAQRTVLIDVVRRGGIAMLTFGSMWTHACLSCCFVTVCDNRME